MKNRQQYIQTVLLTLLITSMILAVEFTFEGTVEGIFDNREFPELASPSETTFGMRPTASFRMRLDTAHSFAIGAHYFFQFGQESGRGVVRPIANYRYDSKAHLFLFGTALRNDIITLPRVLLSDLYDYDNPVFAGTWYQFSSKQTTSTIWVDWVGMASTTQREQFILGAQESFSGNQGLQLSTNFIYNHVANAEGTSGNLQDHGGWHMASGWEWSNFSRIKSLSTNLISILEYSRDRQITMDYTTPWGLSAEAKILFKRFGFGYEHFHHISGKTNNGIIPTSNPIYKENYFDKIDLFFFPLGLQKSPVNIDCELSFIITPGGLNHQEKLFVTFPFDHTFSKRQDD